MEISAAITSQPITASAGGSPISASVSASGGVGVTVGEWQIAASVASLQAAVSASGGIGPPGQAGPAGEAGPAASIALAADATIDSPSDGDVLRYSSSRWRNHPGLQLTDGGSF
jgi:hypothetical protein